ncbi:helix-turn-helix transcriptional regulator [Litorivivens sp.]|uniref:helix-turn-helix transcriptional regulator n=1 Tax=Litorivivens sp. TaxID=2020868 RepID=UPI0035693BF0
MKIESFHVDLVSCEYVWVDKNVGKVPMNTKEWCLYYNAEVTAALQHESRQILLEPNFIYLIPPNTEVYGTLLSSSFQLVLFFHLPSFHIDLEPGVYKSPAIDIVIDRATRLSSMEKNERYGLIGQLYSNLLVSYVLSQLDIALFKRTAIDRRIQKSVSYLNRSYTECIAIEDLAKRQNMTRESFSRLFKKELGRPPFEYIVNLRMNKARLLLQNSNQSIKSIANVVGYSDQYNFSRLFKKYYGMSPKAYRLSHPKE